MKVRELMTTSVSSCGLRSNAAEISEILWNKACGIVPIVDEKNSVVGVITDRDICIALGTRNCRASELVAEDVMSRELASCQPDDELSKALAVMQTRKVRRLPVVDRDRVLKGIVSLHDIVRQAGGELSPTAIMSLMSRLCERAAPRTPELVAAKT